MVWVGATCTSVVNKYVGEDTVVGHSAKHLLHPEHHYLAG